MADDWEDWEDESFQAPPLASTATKGAAVLAKLNEPDESRFAGEDEEEERPAWEANVPKSQEVMIPAGLSITLTDLIDVV